MIFGDGAAAIVVSPADEEADTDIEYFNSYASGPTSEVNSIIWPNPDFDNSITVYGPEVKSLAGRYLTQMLDEIKELPAPAGKDGSLLDNIDLIVPHQANKTMIIELAAAAGCRPIVCTSTSNRSATRRRRASRSRSTMLSATVLSTSRSASSHPGSVPAQLRVTP